MTVISSTRGVPQFSDIAMETATSMIGGASRESGDTIINNIDSELAKLFIDKNMQLVDGGTLSYVTGSPSTLTLTTTLKLKLNSTVAGGTVTKTITGTSFNFSADGKMLYVILDNRTADSTLSGANVVADATSLPAVTSANQEVFLIAKRVDGATQRLYLYNGQSFGNGESASLGSASVTPSFSDASFEIYDNTTPTKIIKFEASGLTGTNTFTPPPATDTLAGLGTAQTFTAVNTFNAQVRVANGTVSAPSISLNSDEDGTGTGFYRVGANSLGFVANGVNVGQWASGGNWQIGPSGGLSGNIRHTVYGSIVNEAISTLNVLASFSNAANVELDCNVYTTGANARRAIATMTGYNILNLSKATTAASPILSFLANYQDAQTADSALVTTNTKEVLKITGEGLHTFGPSGFTGTHVVNGNMSFGGIILGNETLSKYDEDTTGSTTWKFNGAGTAAGSASTYSFVVVGKQVTLQLNLGNVRAVTSSAGTSTMLVSQTALPSAIRPSDTLAFPVGIVVNGTVPTDTGWISISAAGIMTVYTNAIGSSVWSATNVTAGISQNIPNLQSFTYDLL